MMAFLQLMSAQNHSCGQKQTSQTLMSRNKRQVHTTNCIPARFHQYCVIFLKLISQESLGKQSLQLSLQSSLHRPSSINWVIAHLLNGTSVKTSLKHLTQHFGLRVYVLDFRVQGSALYKYGCYIWFDSAFCTFAKCSTALSPSSSTIRFSAKRSTSLWARSFTMSRIWSRRRGWKVMKSSMRLMNSGRKCDLGEKTKSQKAWSHNISNLFYIEKALYLQKITCLTCSITLSLTAPRSSSSAACAKISALPKFDVMIMSVFLKLMVLPWCIGQRHRNIQRHTVHRERW